MEVALDFALAGRAGPPVGAQAPGVLHHPAGRLDRLRGEPAEEVPGHLPDQLRQRPQGRLRGDAAGRHGLDGPRGADLPGGQPAHQAAGLLGVADPVGQGRPPGRAVPGRGVHPAGAAVGPGAARLHPELHVLHLADQQAGADRVRRRPARPLGRGPAEPVRQHAGHPARVAAARRPGHVRAAGRARRDDLADLGRLLRLRAVRARPGPRGQRGVPGLREVPAAAARLRARARRGPLAGAVDRASSTPSAARTRRCSRCAHCTSTTSTTTRCWPTPSRTRPPATPWSPSSPSTRTAPRRARSGSTCRRSGSMAHDG